MLRRLLTGLSIASLLVGLVILVFWYRSFYHTDHYTIGSLDSTQTVYTSHEGRIMVTTSQNVGGSVSRRSELYPYWRVAVWSLTIPAFWVAITIRSKLPRPGRARLNFRDWTTIPRAKMNS